MQPMASSDAIFTRLAGMDTWTPSLEALLAGVGVLSRSHPRMSLQQAIAFVYVALCNARMRQVTFSDVRDRLQVLTSRDDKKSATLLDGLLPHRDGLGWIEQREDPDDRRRKWLILSYDGRMVADEMIAAMAQARDLAEKRLPADLEAVREANARQTFLDL